MNQINLGIAGTGRMAALMMPAIHHARGVTAVAVSSNVSARAQKFAADHGIANPCDGLNAMLDDSGINAVYVANATVDHAATAIAALRAGKHVLCEKPFATTGDEGERVIAAASRSGKLFMEGLWTLCLQSYQRVYSLVTDRALGDVVHCHTDFGYRTTPELMPRLFDRNGGGVMLDRLVYPLGFAIKMFGAVDLIEAQLNRNEDGVDLHVNVQTRHAGGVTGQLAASMMSVMSNTAAIACADGVIRLPSPALDAETVVVERHELHPPADGAGGASKLKSALKQNPLARRMKSALGGGGEIHSYGANQYLPQMQHFAELIVAGKVESDIVPHFLSLEVIKTIDRIRAIHSH